MITPPQHTTVLIVGAGPSGLMMAAQLLRYGIQPVIIDSRQGPTNQSRALAVQARSLEIYRQMGIVDKVLEGGKRAQGLAYHQDGEQLATFDLNQMGGNKTLFPFVLLYQQSKNERLLLDYLTQACCPVYWQTSLTGFKQNGTLYNAVLQNGDTAFELSCTYIIGADGAHSTVRKQLGLHFTGDTYQHQFYLADVQLYGGMDQNVVSLFLTNKGFAGFFPLPEANSFRIVANLPDTLASDKAPDLQKILPYLQDITQKDITIDKINWFTVYKLHHRMADKFSEGNCFLIGDAAHIHSPVGGQGMNTGLQDAYNLAWKLAAVINKQVNPGILKTYAEERMPVAKGLLNTTDRIFNIIMSRTWFSNLLKRYIAPQLLNLFWKADKMRDLFFERISQTGINYRGAKLSLGLGRHTHIKAGDRLPYLEIVDEKKQQKTDIHTWCSKPGFTLITFGDIPENYLFTLAKWITQDYNGSLNFFHLPFSEANLKVFDTLQIAPGTRKAVIVRPDMHIGYLNDTVDISMMNNYLRNVVGFNHTG